MFSLGLTLIGMIVFVFQKRKIQFYIFSLSAFFQFTLGDFRSVPELLLIEWITPIFFIILVNEMIPLSGLKRSEKLIDFRGTEMFIVGIILLIVTVAVSFGKNEMFNSINLSGGTGTKRTYFGIVNNILIFFTTVIYLSRYFSELDIPEFIKLMLITSVTIGLLRLATYFLGFSFPLMSGGFGYGDSSTSFGGIAFRIGGLQEATIVGVSALFADFYLKKKPNIFYAFCLLIIQFMSGGRTILVAIIIAIAIYSTFFLKRAFVYLIFLAAIGIIIAILTIPYEVIEGQIGRMSALTGGVEEQSSERYMVFMHLLQSFHKNPIWGKGIADYYGIIIAKNEDMQGFVRAQLFSGGHGSYTSILGIFGIVGFLFFFIFTYGTAIFSLVKIKKYLFVNDKICAFATFIFVASTITTINLITSYNGFGVSYLFFMAGLIVSLRINENLNKISI